MKYNELYSNCTERLTAALNDRTEAESSVRLLFYYMLSMDRSALFMRGNDDADEISIKRILDAAALREKRIPLQHITGRQEFMGLEFYVTPDVLVPRFDTECLVEEAMLVTNDGDKVLDVCTGSGCILISLMNYKNDIKGYGVDISDRALLVAEKNAELCKHNERADMSEYIAECRDDNQELCKQYPTFILSDLFENIDDTDFDVIVSNPPYIRSDVIDTLEPEVRDHDPLIALDGGEDGLIFYRRIISDARSHLKAGGYLLVEIGCDQGDDVSGLFVQNGYRDVAVIKDLAGNDRVVRGRL